MRQEGAFAPFLQPVFRATWLATLISNVRAMIQSTGAARMVTSLIGSPRKVVLTRTAATLPHAPSWQASIRARVPIADLVAAVGLNSIHFNLVRAVGATRARRRCGTERAFSSATLLYAAGSAGTARSPALGWTTATAALAGAAR